MTRTRDPFPVQTNETNRHLRVRYQPTIVNPVEIELARIEAEREQARQEVQKGQAKGKAFDADPADLRGIPCIARGVGGTSPGTNPWTAIDRIDRVPSAA